MDKIKERLETTAAECLKCFETWREDDKDLKARGALNEAIHELRKVASRLEIELAISDRDQMVQSPIPIPVHPDNHNRSAQDNHGNGPGPGSRSRNTNHKKGRNMSGGSRRRTPRKPPQE